MYLDQKKWSLSQINFKKAMSNHKKAEHRAAYEGTIVFLATAYYYAGKYEEAKEYIDKAVLITSRRKDVSFYDTTSRAVQMLLQSTVGKCNEKDVDLLAKEVIDSASERENNRECFYISQIYLKINNQKKADKFQKLCKKGLMKTAEKISDPKNRTDYMNTSLHKHMLKDVASSYINKDDIVISEKISTIKKVKKSFEVTNSICPQYGDYFNFCPSCAYNNIKNDFKFCPNCGTSLELR